MSLSDASVAREARYEALIDEAFDQAETYARAAQLERALEWLAKAEDLAGGLPDAYIELRERWVAALAPPPVGATL